MLRTNALMAAYNTTKNLEEQGIHVVPMPNSELSELVRFSHSPIHLSSTNDTITSNPEAVLSYYGSVLTSDTGTDLSEHTKEIETLSEQLANIVRTHVSYAKNIVKPKVMAFGEKLSVFLQDNKSSDPAADFEVVAYDLPELLLTTSFLNSLEFYNGKSAIIPSARLSLKSKTEEEVRAMLSTGSSKTDELVKAWMLSKPVNYFSSIWNSLFTTEPVTGIISCKAINECQAVDAIEYALAIYLISIKLSNEVETTEGMNLQSYKNIVRQYQEFSATVILRSINIIAVSIRTGNLIINQDKYKHCIMVHGPVYADWLKSGGKVEALYGMLTSNEVITNVTRFNEKAKDFENNWKAYTSYHHTKSSNTLFEKFKEEVYAMFTVSYGDLDDSEKELYLKNPAIRETAAKLFKEEVARFKYTDMDTPYEIALLAIAKYRFGYTSAYQILSDINEASKHQPEIDVREAALLAVVNYVSDYVSNQITFHG
jgi:hypothetical protein